MNHLRGSEVANKELKRGLEARHIQMIALGGTIGVGLFMGSASTIKWTGPSVMLAMQLQVFLSSSSCVPWEKCCIWSQVQDHLQRSVISIFTVSWLHDSVE